MKAACLALALALCAVDRVSAEGPPTAPAPVGDAAPPPVADAAPAPVLDAAPAPVLDAAPAPVLDAAPNRHRLTVPLAKLIESDKLAPGENLKVREVFRDEDTSHHLVWLRGGEDSHRHDRHALTVILLRGWGFMKIGTGVRRVGLGSIVYVPRGVVHEFRNESGEVSVAYAIYSPPYDGKDRVEDQ